MQLNLLAYRAALVLGFLLILYVTVHAVTAGGASNAGNVFMAGFAQPWPAQFNTDFGLHLLLIGSWLVFRSRHWALGLLWAFIELNLGTVFLLPFVLITSLQEGGDFRKILLGARFT